MLQKYFSALFLVLSALLLSGCQTPQPYDYSALNKSKPRSILVIPPANNTVEVNAPYIFLSTITRPLAEKGYYVFPVSMIENFFRESGMALSEEMNEIPLDKIRQHIGPDAVLYVTIDEWGQKYELLASRAVVSSTWRLIDARTGEVLWDATARAEQKSDDGNQGLIGALVNAVVTQIVGTLADHTPMLSSNANTFAIFNAQRGLLNGPYAPIEAETAK